MVTFDTHKAAGHRRSNRRKAVESITFWRRRSEGDVPVTLFTANNELVDLIADGFQYGGLITADGLSFEREDSTEGTPSHGYYDNTREDLQSSEGTFSVTFQEDKRVINELCDGADYRDLEVGTNELVKYKPAFPRHEEWTMISVYRDGPAGNEHLKAKILPTVKVQSAGAEQWGNETTIDREVTFKRFVDEELNTPEIEISGGTAFFASLENQGWAEGN